MTSIPSIIDKCKGAFLASAIGDALGWPYERNSGNISKADGSNYDCFSGWKRRTGGRFWSHIEVINAGEYSDDTQMIFSVSRSIISGEWSKFFSSVELPYWLEYERGGGKALKSAARAYRGGYAPWKTKNAYAYFAAGGNGAAMRILPHVISQSRHNDVEKLMEQVFLDSTLTHGHPRAILGATCYAYALQAILKRTTVLEFGELISIVLEGASIWGKYQSDIMSDDWKDSMSMSALYSYGVVWEDTVKKMINGLISIQKMLSKGILISDRTALQELGCFSEENGAGDITILSALYLASKYANNPSLGVKIAAHSIDADTDTLASITGGLLGMLSGLQWIPVEWTSIQDYNCMCDIVEILLAENPKETSRRIRATRLEDNLISSPIGKLHCISTEQIRCGRSGIVTIRKMMSLLGQTLYIKEFKRNADEATPIRGKSELSSIEQPPIKKLSMLKDDPLFSRISFRKVMQIIDMLLEDSTVTKVAQVLKIDEHLVEKVAFSISDYTK